MKKASIVATLLAVTVGWYLWQRPATAPPSVSQAAHTPRTVSLPSEPQSGVSSSWVLYSSTQGNGITAAGQIFTPPEQATVLTRLGFLLHQSTHDSIQPEVSFQIILAKWQTDRPSPHEIWASDIRTLPSTAQTHLYGWQDFDIPRIELEADQEYVAWITLSDLGNPPGILLQIPDMGPRYRSSPTSEADARPIHTYAQGRSAFFREPNPGGVRDHMTGVPWEVRSPGQNLYFRMLFQSTP